MLVRITWALVVAALGTLIGGFFTPDSNVLLFIAIGLALAVIVVVLVSWARRAREATSYGFEEQLAFAESGEPEEEELFAALEREGASGARRRPRGARRRPAPRKAAAKPKGKPKAKPTAKAGARSTVRKTTAKPKATRKAKPKAGGSATRPKSKPTRRRPQSSS